MARPPSDYHHRARHNILQGVWSRKGLVVLLLGVLVGSAAAAEKTCDCRLVLAFGEVCGKGYCPCNRESHYCTSGICQPLSSCNLDSDCRNPDNQSWLDDGKCPSDTEPVCFDDRTCGCGIPCETCPTQTPTTTPAVPRDDSLRGHRGLPGRIEASAVLFARKRVPPRRGVWQESRLPTPRQCLCERSMEGIVLLQPHRGRGIVARQRIVPLRKRNVARHPATIGSTGEERPPLGHTLH